MLLLFSSINERFTSLIEKHLGEDCLFKFNLDADSLKETFVSIREMDMVITQQEKTIHLSDISGVWIKRQSVLITSEEEQTFCGFEDYCNYKIWKDEWNSIIKQIIVHLKFLGVPFFDEADSILNAEKKLLQLDVARAVGFLTPSTIVSNRKSDIQNFLSHHNNDGILKLSTQPTFNKQKNVYFIYANKVSASDFMDLDNTINSPIVVQNYINKQYEVRYTFVNGEHFVCKIESQLSDKSKVDFRRYDFAKTPYLAIDAPENITQKVTLFMQKLNLNYGALDFIVDSCNNWYFLEVNPVGQYGWIEHLTGLQITSSILQFLRSKNIV